MLVENAREEWTIKRAVCGCVGVVVMLCAASSVRADDWEQGLGVPIPVLARIEGYIGTKPPERNNLADWIVMCLDREYPFQVTKLDVLQGNASYMGIVDNARPYHIAYYLRGPNEFLRAFADTVPGEQIVFSAYLRSGSRQANIIDLQSSALPAATPAETVRPQPGSGDLEP
jgi:hypothetical protein